MAAAIEMQLEVPFHDCDMMNVAWHGHYYKYFELLRTELFRSIDCDIPRLIELGYQLPVVESRCKYIAPLTYGLKVRGEALFMESEYRIVTRYRLYGPDQRKRCEGYTTQVAVDARSGELHFVLPQTLRDILEGPTQP